MMLAARGRGGADMSEFAPMLAAASHERPVRLADLVRHVDRRQSIVPDRGELEGIVRSLLDQREASHLGEDRFIAFSAALPEVPFTGITDGRYAAVLEEFRADMADARRTVCDHERRIRTGDLAGGDAVRRTFPDPLEAQVAFAWLTRRPVDPLAITRTATIGSLGFDQKDAFFVVLALATTCDAKLDDVRCLASTDQTVPSMAAGLRRAMAR
jgi:hypothetical protein